MAEHPKSAAEPRPAFELENCQDYTAALGMIAAVRRLFLVLLAFSLLLQAGVYSTARWRPAWILPDHTPAATSDADHPADLAAGDAFASAGDADPLDADSADAPQATPSAASAGATIDPTTARRVRQTVEAVMPLASFAGVISCILLMLCYFVALNLAFSGRLGGVRGSLAGLLWMAVVLVLLLPWEQWLGSLGSPLSGVYTSAAQAMDIPASFTSGTARMGHYARYLGYPLLVLLIALVADRRYARGYRMACRQAEAWLHVRRL
ncbi:MAG: hypothetical protein ACE5GE_01480 [Phycisphaerae bacterium]